MKEQMSHWERVRAALRGDDVDRPPVSMWRHFFAEETTTEGLAEAMLGFQRRFDWDFMKVNPRASCHAEDWGLKMRPNGDVSPKALETPVQRPEDWLKLEVLDPERGVLGEHLRVLEIIAEDLQDDIPILMTVFTPLSVAAQLAPTEGLFLEHLREHGEDLIYALEIVTETFSRFARACLDRGASGLFFATTAWATTQSMTEEEYFRFGRPYDLKLLDSLPSSEFHMLHVCREFNMLHALRGYPVHAFNWDARGKGNPSLAEGKAMLGGLAAVGGLDYGEGLVQAEPSELTSEVRGIRVAMGKTGWMLSPGCTFPPPTPEVNIHAIRQAAAVP